MTRRTKNRTKPALPSQPDEATYSTRGKLLEAAGHVFADKGFDRATGKEICERAGVNTAAVNYYFGGMEGLYAAVIWEAHSRLVTFDAISIAIAGKVDARAKLEAILGLFVEVLTGPASTSWVLRVLGREIVAPSAAVGQVLEKEFLPKSRILKALVGELMGLPPDHPAVSRACVNVMAPCVLLLIFDRRILKTAFPNLGLMADDGPTVTRHLVQYALAGIAGVARDDRKET
jgi:TetR/AcrR family transcriptional regulator, regulator of cefoperazone and chloramphenicol sensitivity